ncbi:MAG: stage III sporulation protein AA [Ruminococcaceae bacterium]|nr:stage III sporulation protein AA [Oscillospiraceae bacterium]
MDKCKSVILSQLPPRFRTLLSAVSFDGLEELRFRRNRPVMLYMRDQLFYLCQDGGLSVQSPEGVGLQKEDMAALTESLFNSSVYAYLQDIRDGFITLRGGHRVGLAGKCILKNGEITNITDISGVNLRVARAYPGCGEALDRMLRSEGLKNTLLIAPPQCGKTTFLRDLARLSSREYKVTVVDERSELAAVCDGVPQFDLGPQTDVLDRFPKTMGMMLAIRSLSPQLLVIDEIGTEADVQAVKSVQDAGCNLLASVHGYGVESVLKGRPQLALCFEQAVVLGRENGVPAVKSVERLG